MSVKIKLELLEGATSPIYATQGAAGFDFRSNEEIVINGLETKLVKTGIKTIIPEGYHISVCSRSGLALKSQIFVLNAPGIIDSDYRGEIGIILHNASDIPYEIKIGDRIAQGVLTENSKAEFIEVDTVSLDTTTRGEGGFGHTGK